LTSGAVSAHSAKKPRQVHDAHRIEMRGESMRKKRNPPPDEKKE